MVNRNKSLIVFFCAIVIAAFVFALSRAVYPHVQRLHCQRRLEAIGCALVRLYPLDHDGMFPSNIMSFAPEYAAHPGLYLCPGSDINPGALTNVDQWIDYVYVYWHDKKTTPTEYPLMYDRSLSYHEGGGINILFVDGSTFWDKKAEWLKKFAKEHPDLKIPLPEDI